jgi:AcrR family transcriptional regulator
MNSIAAAAGLSSGAIYTYFDGKEELFLQAFATLVADEERNLVAAVAAEPSTAQRIRLAVDYFVDAGVASEAAGMRGLGGGFLVHAWAHADVSPQLRRQLLYRREQLTKLARSIVEGAMAGSELPAATDVEGLAGAIGSMLDGLLVQRAEKGEAFGREDARRQAYALIDAIMAARAGVA